MKHMPTKLRSLTEILCGSIASIMTREFFVQSILTRGDFRELTNVMVYLH
jgi:hypothetical protein